MIDIKEFTFDKPWNDPRAPHLEYDMVWSNEYTYRFFQLTRQDTTDLKQCLPGDDDLCAVIGLFQGNAPYGDPVAVKRNHPEYISREFE